MILICISLMISHIEHLLTYLLAMFMSSLRKCLSKSFGHFELGYQCFCNWGVPYIFWRRKWHPTPVLLPGKSHRLRSLVGYSPWVSKSWTRLIDFTSLTYFCINEPFKWPVIPFANISPHSEVSCVFQWLFPLLGRSVFTDVVFLVCFCIVTYAFGVISVKLLPRPVSQSFSSTVSSRSFIGFGLTFKSLIHFELAFVYGVR